MIRSPNGNRLLQEAIGLGLGGALSAARFASAGRFYWRRSERVVDHTATDEILLVPHFSTDRPQDSIEVHYRVTWQEVAMILSAAKLPPHIADAPHLDTSIGYLMPAGRWSEILVHPDDSPDTLGAALLSAWKTVIEPFATEARNLAIAVKSSLRAERLTGPNRDWVRAAAAACVGDRSGAARALEDLQRQANRGELARNVEEQLPEFRRMVLTYVRE